MPNKPAQPAQRLVRALRKLRKEWPQGFWLFADGQSLTLLRTDEGKRMMLPNGCVDPAYQVESFNIPNDGGDW